MIWAVAALTGVCAFCLMQIMVLLERIVTRLDRLPVVMNAEQLGHELSATRDAIRALGQQRRET
jgi:hypothetical protein